MDFNKAKMDVAKLDYFLELIEDCNADLSNENLKYNQALSCKQNNIPCEYQIDAIVEHMAQTRLARANFVHLFNMELNKMKELVISPTTQFYGRGQRENQHILITEIVH